MNAHTPLLVGTFCAALALSSAAGAAPETATPPQAGTPAPAAATPTNAPPAAAPHSHMTEKLGVPANPHASGEAAAPHDKDEKSVKRHNHQRDMK